MEVSQIHTQFIKLFLIIICVYMFLLDYLSKDVRHASKQCVQIFKKLATKGDLLSTNKKTSCFANPNTIRTKSSIWHILMSDSFTVVLLYV